MDFIIILFGLIYWASRTLDNYIQHQKYGKKLEESGIRYRELSRKWEKAVCDRELEKELFDYVINPRNYDEIWKEIHPILQKFPKLSGIKRLCFTTKAAKEYYCLTGKAAQKAAEVDREIAMRILMAKRGKLQHSDAYVGFNKRMLKHCNHDDLIDFLLWINEQLELHGINEEIIIYRMPDYYLLNEDTRMIKGTLLWYPTISYTDMDAIKLKP